MSTTLQELKSNIERRQPGKPLQPKEMLTLLSGIIEHQAEMSQKLDQIIEQGGSAKTTKKTAAKDAQTKTSSQ